ncbi:hypothetical protein [Embleya sp. NPDC001921]
MSTPSGSGSGASAPGTAGPAVPAPRIAFGPGTVTVDASTSYLDLDTSPPLATQSNKAADIVFAYSVGAPNLLTTGSTPTLAVLPVDAAPPTPAQCNDAIGKRGTHTGGKSVLGSSFCVLTDEGRTAYLRLTTPPAVGAPLRMQVTVWEAPELVLYGPISNDASNRVTRPGVRRTSDTAFV